MDLGVSTSGGQSIKEKKEKKKLKIGIHIVLKNYKYLKLLFLNTLKCNNLLDKNKNENKIIFF